MAAFGNVLSTATKKEGIVACVVGGSTAKVSLSSDADRSVIAEFNGARIAARAWPVTGNHVTLIELH